MRLRSKIPVTFNAGIRLQEQGIVTMTLGSVAYSNDFTEIGVNYTYYKEDGTQIRTSAFFINGEATINALFNAIKGFLPPFQNEVQSTRDKFMWGARFEMANTFGITVNDIEFID